MKTTRLQRVLRSRCRQHWWKPQLIQLKSCSYRCTADWFPVPVSRVWAILPNAPQPGKVPTPKTPKNMILNY